MNILPVMEGKAQGSPWASQKLEDVCEQGGLIDPALLFVHYKR